jgi:tetratricopeptide (TPR) repeat protein
MAVAEAVGNTSRALAGLAACALLGMGLLACKKTHPPGHVPLEPIDAKSVRVDVRTLTGVDPGGLAMLLQADSKVAAFAAHAAQGKADDDAKAKAVCEALQARKRQRAFDEWSRIDARDGPPLTASATLAAIARDDARRQLYPLELSALAVASLRSLGVPALVAEVYRYPNERKPVDASGRLGYYAALVPVAAGTPPRVYDAYGGRNIAPKAGDYAVLNDAQAIGAALAIRALHRLNNALDPKGALVDSAAALELLPASASAHSVRAAVALTRAEDLGGAAELETAVKLRNDAARHNNRAMHALGVGNILLGNQELKLALADAPDYALANLMQAAAYLMMQERELARTTLEQVERLDPTLAQLPQIWAQLYAQAGDTDQALRFAQEAVRRKPNDPQPLFILARIEASTGRDADVRTHARELLTHVPAEDRERRKRTLQLALGAEIFDEPAKPGAPTPGDATNTPPHAPAAP